MPDRRSRRLRERIEATADPTRFALVGYLAAGPATARMLADQSGVEIGKVRYLLGRWLAAGIVEEHRREDAAPRRRGRHYRLSPEAFFVRNAEAGATSPGRLNQARSRQVGLMMRQAMALAGEGMFGVLNDHAASRLPMTVDPEGREKAIRLTEETISSVAAICEDAGRRLGSPGRVSYATTVAIGFFGRPPVRHSEIDRIDLAQLAPRGRGPRNIRLPGGREDPLRFEIEYQLIVRPHTVAELVAELGVSPSSVRRALSSLESRSAVEVESLRPTRGTAEKRWVGSPRAKYNATIPGRPGNEERKAYEQRQVRIVAREMLASARAGQLGDAASTFAWLPSILDNQALSAAHDLMAKHSERMLELREECLRRGAWESTERLSASTVLVLFRHR